MSNSLAEIKERHHKYSLEWGFFAGYGNRESQDKVDISFLLAEVARVQTELDTRTARLYEQIKAKDTCITTLTEALHKIRQYEDRNIEIIIDEALAKAGVE